MPQPVDPGAPFFIVMNAGSGADDAESLRQTMTAVLTKAGRRHQVLLVERSADIDRVAAQAVTLARQHDGIVVAAGGDGTLNAVAHAVMGSGCLFGVVPQGTFNYFGRAQGLSLDTAQATRDLMSGQAHAVQVGTVNDRLFLVNASVGLYPELLEDREAYKHRYGRNRLVALWAGVRSALRGYRHMHLSVEGAGRPRELRTLTLFVGNNKLQLEQVGLPQAPALEHGYLAAVVLAPVSRWRRLMLIVRGALGTLGGADDVESFAFRRMTVRPRASFARPTLKVATDGEVFRLRPPLAFGVAPEPLMLIRPVGAGAG